MKNVILFLLFFSITMAKAQTAVEIIKKMDDNMRGKTSQAELVIRTIRPTWSREMSVKTWMKGKDFAMILVQSPPKDKGIVFLKRKKEVWNWIPTLERNIKLPPSMMTNSWMGTDFTNDDLVKESSIVEDYIPKLLGDTTIDQRQCFVIELMPKAHTAVVWSKLIVSVDKKNFIELNTEFFDDEEKLISILKCDDIKMMDGRLIPTRFQMIPVDKKNQRTEIIYKSILFNRVIEEKFFSTEKIRQIN